MSACLRISAAAAAAAPILVNLSDVAARYKRCERVSWKRGIFVELAAAAVNSCHVSVETPAYMFFEDDRVI